MNEAKHCQSCGMPMGETNEMYGLNSDGSKSEDYCSYCYENGKFTMNGNMEQMIEICIPFMVEEGMDADESRKILVDMLPNLKRWKNN